MGFSRCGQFLNVIRKPVLEVMSMWMRKLIRIVWSVLNFLVFCKTKSSFIVMRPIHFRQASDLRFNMQCQNYYINNISKNLLKIEF